MADLVNKITHIKPFLSNPLFSNFFTNKSIWTSTKLNDLVDIHLLNSFNACFNHNGSNNFFFKNYMNFKDFDYMEDSIM